MTGECKIPLKSEDIKWAQDIADRIVEKELKVARRSRGKIPYTTVDGVFDDCSERIGWWTNGFYAGMMWLLYAACGEKGTADAGESDRTVFREIACETEDKLEVSFGDYMLTDHDNGFKWLLTSVMNYRLTGSEKSKNSALLAANGLAGRFNPAGNFIRAWNDWDNKVNRSGYAIIDCMMNLPLLYWASEMLDDPRFKNIAMCHADTAAEAFVRENGSVCHIVSFDPKTGSRKESLAGQGKAHGSSWTRGQAWALYGFALSYKYTGKKEYLDTAEIIAAYIIGRLAEWEYMPVDFEQEKELDWEDSTASAIMACGFLELSKFSDNYRKYYETALSLVKKLAEKRCDWSDDTDNITTHCSAAYNDKDHNFSIIYGDYYFTEAILKIAGKEIPCP